MIRYYLKQLKKVRALTPIKPRTKREIKFSQLWQSKKFDEAMEYFPDEWAWFSEDISNEEVTDMPGNLFIGVILSQRAFKEFSKEFPEDVTRYKSFQLDGIHYVWIEVQPVNSIELKDTKLNICVARPSYKTYFSEKFVEFFKRHSFTGNQFVPEEV